MKKRTPGRLVEPGEFSRFDLHEACWAYIHSSVNDSLNSNNPLIASLAVLNTKVGKGRLKKLAAQKLHPLTRRFLEIRLQAECKEVMTVLKFKERWVCFDCRKMFRVLRQGENAEPGMRPDSPQRSCSACGAAMYNIGSFFAPPPRSSVRRWEAAHLVAAAGYHCHSVKASQFFWELVGPARPDLQDVMYRIKRWQRRSNNGSRLLDSIEQKRKY